MNWDAIGAIGEIIGATAVVATLFYLATQVRHGVKLAESDAFERATKSYAETQSQLLDPRLGELYLRGRQSYSALDELEKLQFNILIVILINKCVTVWDNSWSRMLKDTIRKKISLLLLLPGKP